MLQFSSRNARTGRENSSRRPGSPVRRRPSIALRAQLEPLEGRALMSGPNAFPATASYWVGDWQTANGDLLDVSEDSGHHPGDPPVLMLFYETGRFLPDFTTKGYPFYALNYYDSNPDPDAATLSGNVYGDFSFAEKPLGTFVFHAVPAATSGAPADAFTGSITVGGHVTSLQGTFVGDLQYPAAYEPGWGLPRDQPNTPVKGNPSPPPSGKAVLQTSIQGVGPATLIANSPNGTFTHEIEITITNVGSATLPRGSAHLLLKNRSKAAKLKRVTIAATLPLSSSKVTAKQAQFSR